MLNGKFTVELDGQEAAMICMALMDKARSMNSQSTPAARMHRILALRIANNKVNFHAEVAVKLHEKYITGSES